MAEDSNRNRLKVRASDFLLAGAMLLGVGYYLARESPQFFLGWASGIGLYIVTVILVALADWEARNHGKRPAEMPVPGPEDMLASPNSPMANVTILGPASVPGGDDAG